MQQFKRIDGLVVPLDRAHVDTDQIIPKQFLKSIFRTGYGVNLFDEWRYLDEGYPGQDINSRLLNPDFVLNQARYQGASVLLAEQNFGCGSSREHAPWALMEYGFRVIIAPGFADIFFNNCYKNGLLPVVLPPEWIRQLFAEVAEHPGYRLVVDLEAQEVITPSGQHLGFAVESFRKYCLLHGLDDIGLTLQQAERISTFEARRRQQAPWLFGLQSNE